MSARHASSMEIAVDAPRERSLAVVAALVTVTLWASAFVAIRWAGVSVAPGALTLGRLLVGVVALGALLRVRGERLPSRDDLSPVWRPLLACALLWFGAY